MVVEMAPGGKPEVLAWHAETDAYIRSKSDPASQRTIIDQCWTVVILVFELTRGATS
jgi:hypothetical protein